MKPYRDDLSDPRDEAIFTTALLLGCDLENVNTSDPGPWGPLWAFTGVDGKQSGTYRSKVTACDMWLSQVGVYVDPQGVIFIPPKLKETLDASV